MIDKTQIFVEKAVAIHGNRYNYKQSQYVNKDTKVDIICDKHGLFKQTPNNHLYNRSTCPHCAQQVRNKKKMGDIDQIIQKANKIHNNVYDYSKVIYVNCKQPVEIICLDHGSFFQRINGHVSSKQGCPICRYIKSAAKNRLTTEQFIEKSRKKHGNRYDYSKAVYKDSHTKVTIVCSEHGEFQQIPYDHHRTGCGCPHCSYQDKQGGITATYFINNPERKYDSAILYLIKIIESDKQVIKIGITTRTITQRYKDENIIYMMLKEYVTTLYDAYTIEQSVLEQFANKKVIPKTRFGGWTECFPSSMLQEIKTYINSQLIGIIPCRD